jgi:dihydrofolate synthase/folylpolyglutamate synthase
LGDLEASAYEAGMREVYWPGRLQRLTRGRLVALLPGGAELWLDGGHNPDGGRVLAAAMADLEERSPAPLVLISAMLATKDSEAFLANFKGLARELVAVPLNQQAAARPPAELATIAERVGLRASVSPGIEAALDLLNDTIWERPPRVLICGTLYLAGEVLAQNGTPPV